MEIVRFKEENEDLWDDFVENQSVNGTFLQTRRFLNYHKDKFIDESVMIYNDKKLVALCPACRVMDGDDVIFYSHKGSTFGGLLVSNKEYKSQYVLPIVKELKDYLAQMKFCKAYLKITSNIFSTESSDLLQYCLHYFGFQEYIEISTYIDFHAYKEEILANFSRGKRTKVHNCQKRGMFMKKLELESEIKEFYSVLCENLLNYNTKPVHSLNELVEFKYERLKGETDFFGIYLGNEMVAGSMVFYFLNTNTVHTQYLAAKQSFHTLSPMTFLFYCLIIEMKRRGFSKLSWGIATENLGEFLNKGLLESKERFGSKHSLNRTYYFDFS